MKRPAAAYWMGSGLLCRLSGLLSLLGLIGAMALAGGGQAAAAQQPPRDSRVEVTLSEGGKAIRFAEAELSFAQQDAVPESSWNRRALPALWLSDEARQRQDGDLSVRARMRFDGAGFDSDSISLFTEDNRERITLSLNGVEIFRNYSDDRRSMLGWNHPYLIPLPRALLRPGSNEIVILAQSGRQHSLGIGTLMVGDHNALGGYFERQNFVRIDAPKTLNWLMLLLSAFIFVMWLGRRQETELLWLSLTGLFWFTRNYHFFAETAPFNPLLFQQITYYSIYFAVAVTLAFCAEFLKIRHRSIIIMTMLGFGLLLSLIRLVLAVNDRTDMASSLMTVLLFGSFLLILLRHAVREKSAESWWLLILLSLALLTGIHDIGRIPNIDWWSGAGFHFQPYIGFLLFLVFMLSLARRFLGALSLVEETNIHLETRVKQATDALAASQQAQRQMEVERALETERERLMREMHDGIGSSLVTALAVARQRQDPPSTITVLQRAISDLKITVDSLAPIEGDVVTLLANLRHRMEQELAQAGIASIWQVENCPPLDWMDAAHSLHLLRLLQEALSNVLQHAGAQTITLSCRASARDGRPGIEISIVDDGIGFDRNSAREGRGMAFMHQRATILNGVLAIENGQSENGQPENSQSENSRPGGTAVRLWLAQEIGDPV